MTHYCKRKELSVLLTNDEEEEDSETLVKNRDKKLEATELDQEAEVLLNSVAGFTTPKTMNSGH